jgi:hypothetical protein
VVVTLETVQHLSQVQLLQQLNLHNQVIVAHMDLETLVVFLVVVLVQAQVEEVALALLVLKVVLRQK